MNSEDTRNIILFVVLSAFILIGWNFLFPPKPRPPVAAQRAGGRLDDPRPPIPPAGRRASRRRPRR